MMSLRVSLPGPMFLLWGLCIGEGVSVQGWSWVSVGGFCEGRLCEGVSVKRGSVKGDRDSPAATEVGDTHPIGYTKLAMLTFLIIKRINWH